VGAHLRERYAAAQNAPESAAAVGPLCLAYHADMFFDHADRCYAHVAALEPEAWRWTYYRALIRAERGGGPDLIPQLQQVVARAPEFGPAWLRLGDAEFKAGRYDAAADAWRRASDFADPEPPSDRPLHVVETPLRVYARLGLARIALTRGDAEQARGILESLTAIAPAFGAAHRLLGDSYRALGRADEAERAIYRAGKRPPFTPYADPMMDVLVRETRNTTFLLRAASEADLSVNTAWAEYLTRRALEFEPDNPEVVVKLARILRTAGRNEEALPFFRRYQELVPDDYQALAHIGSCLSALGRFEEAESYLRRALAGLDDPTTHYNLGVLLAMTGRLDDAIAQYQRALDRDPQYSDARSNLATALARRGDIARAARELAAVVASDPENALARTNLGLLRLQQGQTAAAVRELEEALRLAPGLPSAVEGLAAAGGRQ
jgi:tetratricopeptide (TPR) repeat protein